MKTHYLYPGKIAAFADDTIISTLLGSCVAVALFDASAQVGGLNHFVLPEPPPGDAGGHRYGSDAIRDLIEACIRLGAKKERLKAKIYGGANVIAVSQLGAGIGERNIEAAEKYLKEAGISIIERNVGGEYARTIKLNTTNFDVRHDTTQTQVGADGETAKVDVSGFTTLRTAKNIKVLIVDDSATVRTLFAKIFSSFWFRSCWDGRRSLSGKGFNSFKKTRCSNFGYRDAKNVWCCLFRETYEAYASSCGYGFFVVCNR